MPTQPSDDLISKIRAQNRYRDSMAAKDVGGSVASTAAGGFGGGYALGQQMYKPRATAGFNAQQAVAAKAGLLKDQNDFHEKVVKGKMGLAEALAKQNDNFKTVLGFMADVTGHADSANASVASSFNSGLASLTNEQVKAVMTQLSQTVPDPQALRKGIEDMQARMPNGNMDDPAIAAIFNDLVAKQAAAAGPNGAATTAAITQAVELSLAQRAGGPDNPNPFRSYLDKLAASNDDEAKNAVRSIEATTQDYAKITTLGLQKSEDLAKASIGTMKTGAANADKDIDRTMTVLDSMGIKPSGQKDLAAVLNELGAAGPQNGGASPEAYKKLLDQIDSSTVDPGSTLGEARRRLFADPAFQQWKQQNGFQDDGMALKELRRLTTEKIHNQRQQDRTLIGQRQQQSVGPGTGPSMSAAARVTAPQDTPKVAPAAPGKAQVMTAPDRPYGIVIVAADGTMRDPTDAETNPDGEIGKMLAEPEKWAAFIRPASEYEALKKQADQKRSAGIIDDATKQAMELGGERPKPTLSTVGAETGFLATHPGQLVGRVEDVLLKKMRKKKTDEAVADSAGVNSTAE